MRAVNTHYLKRIRDGKSEYTASGTDTPDRRSKSISITDEKRQNRGSSNKVKRLKASGSFFKS